MVKPTGRLFAVLITAALLALPACSPVADRAKVPPHPPVPFYPA